MSHRTFEASKLDLSTLGSATELTIHTINKPMLKKFQGLDELPLESLELGSLSAEDLTVVPLPKTLVSFRIWHSAKLMSLAGLEAAESRDLDCQYKTAFVLAHKLREAMVLEVQSGEVLEGHVEIDGSYFGGHIRPHNEKAKRVDRRLKRHQTGKRRVVIAMRERRGRTLPFVGQSEAEGVALAVENVSRTSTMSADEAAWSKDSTTTLAHSTCISTQTTLLGWKTTAAPTTAG